MADMAKHRYDVLIIGAGGAGLRAAIEASATGLSVGVVCKSLLGKAHTVMAEGGMAASMGNVDERDNWKVHFADTMRGGQYLNNWRMAQLHAQEAPARVIEMEAWGALFDRTKEGRILQRNFGGHAYPRLAHVGDRTGLEMIRTLQDHGIHQGLEFHMECTVLRLFTDGNRVTGAFGYDRELGRFRAFEAKAIVMATGGVGRAYKITSNSWEYTGDGHTLAYDVGAEMLDMEFVQFHPTGMVWPPSVRGILVTEGVRGEGGVLRNSEGKRFMFDNIPDLYKDQTADNEEEGWRYVTGDRNARRPPELLTRDHVARMILAEVKAGRGSPHGGAFLDIAWIKDRVSGGAEHIRRKLPSMHHQFKQLANLDITEEPMEVGPTTHYVMGGHLGRRGLPDDHRAGPLRGRRVCLRAARRQPTRRQLPVGSARLREARRRVRGEAYAADNGDVSVADSQLDETARFALEPFDREGGGGGPYQVQYDLQDMMQEKVGIIRTHSELDEALGIIEELKERARTTPVGGNREYNPGWHTALDLHNLLSVSQMIALAARERTESRGAHTRDDHEGKNPDWGNVNLVLKKGADGEMQIEKRPIAPMPDELTQIIEEQG